MNKKETNEPNILNIDKDDIKKLEDEQLEGELSHLKDLQGIGLDEEK